MTITNGTGTLDATFRSGGGIFNEGTLTVSNAAFTDNDLSATNSSGGAIFNKNGAALTVINSTFTGNSAEFGGAIENDGFSTITVSSSTFTGNNASAAGGAIDTFGR